MLQPPVLVRFVHVGRHMGHGDLTADAWIRRRSWEGLRLSYQAVLLEGTRPAPKSTTIVEALISAPMISGRGQ